MSSDLHDRTHCVLGVQSVVDRVDFVAHAPDVAYFYVVCVQDALLLHPLDLRALV